MGKNSTHTRRWRLVSVVTKSILILFLLLTPLYAQCNGQTSSGNICGNPTGSQAPPSLTSLSSILDRVYGTSIGSIIYRGSSVWTALPGNTTSTKYLSESSSGTPSWSTVSSGVTSGAPTSGCVSGALIYTDPSTGNIRCDNQTTVTNGFFGLNLTIGLVAAVQGQFGTAQVGSLAGTGVAPDFTAGTCAVSGALGATISGSFAANGACAGGTIVLTSVNAVPNGLSCMINNQTSAARAIRQTATTSSPSVTATFTATINSGDVINYLCVGY
jgi:hypothetical protein